MNPSVELYLILTPIAILILAFTLTMIIVNDKSIAARILSSQLGLIALWLIFNTIQVLSGKANAIYYFAKASYLCIVFLPTAWYCFAVFFAGREPLKRKMLWILVGFSTIVLLLNWTNEYHHLIWKSYKFEQIGKFVLMQVQHGPVFWIFAIYSYIFIILGSIKIIQMAFNNRRAYRYQAICLAVGALVPLIMNLDYLIRSKTTAVIDYSPLGFAFGSLAISIGMYFFKLFNGLSRQPNPHGTQQSLGILLLDECGEIIMSTNPASSLLKKPLSEIIGKNVQQFFPEWNKWIEKNKLDFSFDLYIDNPHPLSIYSTRMVGATTNRLVTIREISYFEKTVNQYKILSEYDGLLNINNRRHFLELAEKRSNELKSSGNCFSIIFFDVDDFKSINDNFGHFFGDEILISITDITKKIIRKSDLFGRYGGDEFIVFLPSLNEKQALKVANRLRKAISDFSVEKKGKVIKISISLGLVCSMEDDNLSLLNLIDFADKSLFKAKRNGRKKIQIYESPLSLLD
ncbi:MAG: hypothetical protein C0412_17425 [Flavobacterium sp.]|nr:hypothetical protein [Flavobacterium sp.]